MLMYLTLSPETNWIVGWVVYVDISVDIPFMVSFGLDALVVIVMVLDVSWMLLDAMWMLNIETCKVQVSLTWLISVSK